MPPGMYMNDCAWHFHIDVFSSIPGFVLSAVSGPNDFGGGEGDLPHYGWTSLFGLHAWKLIHFEMLVRARHGAVGGEDGELVVLRPVSKIFSGV